MREWQTFAVLAALTLAGSGCARVEPSHEGAASPAEAPRGRVVAATGDEARRLVEGGATLLDVRTRGEFEQGHLEGAQLVPVQELAVRLAEVPRDRPVVVYCRSGHRSSQAAALLAESGYEVHDLGSIQNW